MHTPENMREAEIKKLGLSQPLTQLLLGNLDLGGMQYLINKPFYFYASGWPDNPGDWTDFSDQKLLPLWEYQTQVFALDILPSEPKIMSFYCEFPEQPTFYKNFESLLFHIIYLHVWEFGGDIKEGAEAIEFAKLLKMPNFKELEKLLADPDNASSEDIDKYQASL